MVLMSTNTSTGGGFSFEAVSPGPYTVTVSHPELAIENSTAEVALLWGNQQIEHKFIVSGYDLRGLVRASGESIVGVSLLLYPAAANPSPPINCNQEAAVVSSCSGWLSDLC